MRFIKHSLSPALCQRDVSPVFRLQLGCLAAAGLMEFLFIITGGLFFNWTIYYLVETYLLIPAVLFLGATLSQYRELSTQARRQLFLCIGMAVWFIITQVFHRAMGMEAKSIAMFFGVYLIALPFASASDDGAKQKGLKLIAWLFIAASITLVFYSAMLKFQFLPAALSPYIYWDGARLYALWHPNGCACLFMIGIVLCLGFFFRSRQLWQKCLLIVCVVLQFWGLSLTHSRTSTFLACGLVSGILFFTIWKGGWKRFLIALAAALILFPSLYFTSEKLFSAHNAQLIRQYTQQAEQAAAQEAASGASEQSAPAASSKPDLKLNEDGYLQGTLSYQESLSGNLRTLNGRTGLWKTALTALRDDRLLLLFGTEYPGQVLYTYGSYTTGSCHNSWLEITLHMGLPGLLAALVLTVYALVNAFTVLWKRENMWQVCIALLTLGLLAAGFLESLLFTADDSCHFFSFLFLILVGYLSQWRKSVQKNAPSTAP